MCAGVGHCIDAAMKKRLGCKSNFILCAASESSKNVMSVYPMILWQNVSTRTLTSKAVVDQLTNRLPLLDVRTQPNWAPTSAPSAAWAKKARASAAAPSCPSTPPTTPPTGPATGATSRSPTPTSPNSSTRSATRSTTSKSTPRRSGTSPRSWRRC